MPRDLPKQRGHHMRGQLADLLRCRVERTEDRAECHRRLDRLLDRIERLERTGPDPASLVIGTIIL